MTVYLRTPLLVVTLVLSTPVNSGFIETPYTQRVLEYDSELSKIATLYDLTESVEKELRLHVSQYIFFGPCFGSIHNDDKNKYSALSDFQYSYLSENPSIGDIRYYSAKNSMISYMLTTSNLGRLPFEYTCRYASETAFKYIESGTDMNFCFTDIINGQHTKRCTGD